MRRQSGCAREKSVKLRLPDLVLIDMRLAVKDDFRAADAAGEIHRRDHIEGNAGKGKRVNDIQGGEDVAGDLVIAIDGNCRRIALFRSKLFSPRPDDRHHIGRQTVQEMSGFGVRS